jgi:hypothetical protein
LEVKIDQLLLSQIDSTSRFTSNKSVIAILLQYYGCVGLDDDGVRRKDRVSKGEKKDAMGKI